MNIIVTSREKERGLVELFLSADECQGLREGANLRSQSLPEWAHLHGEFLLRTILRFGANVDNLLQASSDGLVVSSFDFGPEEARTDSTTVDPDTMPVDLRGYCTPADFEWRSPATPQEQIDLEDRVRAAAELVFSVTVEPPNRA
jgi:hypothetical protein